MKFAAPPRRLNDASNEDCPLHKWNVYLIRLANHAKQKKNEAKLKMVEVLISSIGKRIVIPKASRDIVPFEQLRSDYGYKVAQALFDDSS